MCSGVYFEAQALAILDGNGRLVHWTSQPHLPAESCSNLKFRLSEKTGEDMQIGRQTEENSTTETEIRRRYLGEL